MSFEREKATLFAENLKDFNEYVLKNQHVNQSSISDPDKLYRLKLLIDEFRLQILADELVRINKFFYDEKFTPILVGRAKRAIEIIGDYIDQNSHDLFIFTAKLYTLRWNLQFLGNLKKREG